MSKRRTTVSGRRESAVVDAFVVGIIGVAVLLLTSGAFAQDARIADPMRPPVQAGNEADAAGAAAPLRVEGIVVSATRRLVMIAGEFLTEGDSIFGLRVERIEQHAVTLRDASRTLVLVPDSAPPAPAVIDGDPQ